MVVRKGVTGVDVALLMVWAFCAGVLTVISVISLGHYDPSDLSAASLADWISALAAMLAVLFAGITARVAFKAYETSRGALEEQKLMSEFHSLPTLALQPSHIVTQRNDDLHVRVYLKNWGGGVAKQVRVVLRYQYDGPIGLERRLSPMTKGKDVLPPNVSLALDYVFKISDIAQGLISGACLQLSYTDFRGNGFVNSNECFLFRRLDNGSFEIDYM